MGLFEDTIYVAALEAAGFQDVAVEKGFDGRGRFIAVLK